MGGELNLRIEIRRNADGVVAVDTWPAWDYNEYWWRGGNAWCDCNRELFYLQALGQSPELDSVECSDGRYSVRLTDADTGVVLYNEIDPLP